MLDRIITNRKVNKFSRQVGRFYMLVDSGNLQDACEYAYSRNLGADILVPVAEMLYDELVGDNRYGDAAFLGAKYGVSTDLVRRAEILDFRSTAVRHEKKAGYLLAEAQRNRDLAEKLEDTWKRPKAPVQPSIEELNKRRKETVAERERDGLVRFEQQVAGGNLLMAQHIVKTYLGHKPEYLKKVHLLMLEQAVKSGDDKKIEFVMSIYRLSQQDLQNIRSFLESEKAAQGNNLANNSL